MEKLVPKLRFPEFEGDWEKKRIDEISKISRGKSKHRPRNASFLYNGKYPFIQTGDIREANLYINTYNQTYSEEGLKQSKLWNENTLCITIAANIAETAILKIKACFPDSIIGLIPLEDKSVVHFIKYQFDKFKIDIQKLSQGVAQDNLNQEKLSKIIFNVPSLPEQQKIATFLTSVDERIALLEKQKQGLETYKKGVMQQLFSQKLRFKDDKGKDFPDWEEKKLGDEVLITKGQQLNKETLSLEGNYPCQNGGIEPSGYTDNFNAYENTITISEGGNSCGYVNYMSTKFWCGGHCYTLTDVKLENKFLYQYLKYHQEQIMNLRVGSGLPNIQKSTLSSFKIHKPCLEEQKKIASFLSAIDARIEVVSKQIEQSKVFKKGLLQQLFV